MDWQHFVVIMELKLHKPVLHLDLDNTLIYSYKHDIGIEKRCVEVYQGREISFMTERTCSALKQAAERFVLVPATTRTLEQYERIDLGIGPVRYALVCNGGLLLKDGILDKKWYEESKRRIEESEEELRKAQGFLRSEKRREFELRFIEDLFLFTKCREPEAVVKELCGMLDVRLVDVFHNGTKVYVVPKALSKGKAVERFRSAFDAPWVAAAGDSEFDVSMLQAADAGLAPYGFLEKISKSGAVIAPELYRCSPVSGDKTWRGIREALGKRVFSEELFEMLEEVEKEQNLSKHEEKI